MKKLLLILLTVNGLSAMAQDFDWAINSGGTNNDFGLSIARDSNGDIYTTGSFEGTVDFDPGAGVFNLTSAGGTDGYIQKLDEDGNFIWAKSFGGASSDRGAALVMDANNNVYTTGYFTGTADLDPSAGTLNLTTGGGTDIFLQKLDVNGNFVWANQINGSNYNQSFAIAVDGDNNIYTTGRFLATADFDPSANSFNMTSVGTADIFIQKLDEDGDFIWAKQMGGTDFDHPKSIKVDGNNNIYTTGTYKGTSDFDPNGTTFNLTSAGVEDIFVSKLDEDGDFVWAVSMGGTALDDGDELAIDANNDIYIVGSFQSTVDFDPSANMFDLTSFGGADGFIQKLDEDGNFIWAKQIGGTAYDFVSTVSIDNDSEVYFSGKFRATADFDPSANTVNLTPNGFTDAYVEKLDANGNFMWVKLITGSADETPIASVVDDNENYYISGYFEETADFDPSANTSNLTAVGDFDAFVFKLKYACVQVNGTDIRTECNAYTWIDGVEYTSNNNSATHNIIGGAANGCDSLVTLDLTIITSTTGTDTRTECNAFTWIDGIEYIANNNTATHNIVGGAANGCDSLVTLDLTINTLDVTTSLNGFTISANNATAVAYQWINCSNNSAVSGATQATFTPESNEDYAVIVSDNDCSDTSDCVTVGGLGINNLNSNLISIFPNPSEGTVNINLGDLKNVDIKVYSISGQLVYNQNNINATQHQFELNVPAGVYFVEVIQNDFKAQLKLIIK